MNGIKIGVLMYTYNRTDDARINMEIIRNVWSKNELLKDVTIVHSFNGEKEWWPEKYLEDELLYLENPGHFEGAELLINEGIKTFQEKYSQLDYVIILASDTWLVLPEYVENIIFSMKKNIKYMATCPWGNKEKNNMWNIGVALDFNIIDLKWATKYNLFPIRYKEFVDKYSEIFFYSDQMIYPERVLALRFKQSILKSVDVPSEQMLSKVATSYVHRMTEREPVHDEKTLFGIKKGRKMYWKNIGLITHHEPVSKQKVLKQWKIKLGKYGNNFLESKDLSNFNNGVTKTIYIKNDKKIGYGD